MFTNMRFEPAGMTDDPEIRFATSLVDYIFRRLAVEYMDLDERRDLGILTIDERSAADAAGRGGGDDGRPRPASTCCRPRTAPRRTASPTTPPAPPAPPAAEVHKIEGEVVLCYVCGDIMQRAGSCHACPSCGATSGCS